MNTTTIILIGIIGLSKGLFADEPGFTPLLDGAHAASWRQCGPGGMKIDNGVGTTWTPDAKGVYYGVCWYAAQTFGDFVFRGEFRAIDREYNSGVRIRFPQPANDPKMISDQGYEISILSPAVDTKEPAMETGAIAKLQSPKTPARLNRTGEWNQIEVTAMGHHLVVSINGAVVNDFTGSRRLEGYIGLENHRAGSVQWRNVRIRDTAPVAATSSVASGPNNLRDALVGNKWSWINTWNNTIPYKELLFGDNGVATVFLNGAASGETFGWNITGPRSIDITFGAKGRIACEFDAANRAFTGISADRKITVKGERIGGSMEERTAPEIPRDANQPRIEVLKDQAPNVLEWVLAPLDQPMPANIRQNLIYLREDLLDESKQNPKATSSAYPLGSQLCDKLLAAIQERERTSVEAGYAAAQADADVRVTSQAMEARRNYQMSWPQYKRAESQRAEITRQQVDAADLKKERLKVDWSNRSVRMRSYLDDLYRQFREALR